MSIRTVKQFSDRGNIKNLIHKNEINEEPPHPFELRMKELYELSQLHKDKNLQAALGFITTDYISDKNALPLSIYRIRRIVDDIKSTSSENIDKLSEQIATCISDGISTEAQEYFVKFRTRVKTASANKKPSFWRVSKK